MQEAEGGCRSRKVGQKNVEVGAASHRKFNHTAVKTRVNDRKKEKNQIIKFTGEMKSELLDLAKERGGEESVSKWADTDGGILAPLARSAGARFPELPPATDPRCPCGIPHRVMTG